MPRKLFIFVAIIIFINSCGVGFKNGNNPSVVIGFRTGVIKKEKQATTNVVESKPQSQNTTKPLDPQRKLSVREILYKVQQEWKKTPYVLGGTTINGADCSGFIQSVFSSEFETNIPRTTIYQMKNGVPVAKNQLKAGDLVFFYTGARPHGYHVGIYITNGIFVHLSSHGGARLQNINMNYWKTKYITARRYLK